MMLLCLKQHLSNIWSSIHEEVKQHWGWVKNSVAYKFFMMVFLTLRLNEKWVNINSVCYSLKLFGSLKLKALENLF